MLTSRTSEQLTSKLRRGSWSFRVETQYVASGIPVARPSPPGWDLGDAEPRGFVSPFERSADARARAHGDRSHRRLFLVETASEAASCG